MTSLRPHRAGLSRPGSGGWWMCLLAVFLFVWHVHYARIHLLTEVHHGDAQAEAAQGTAHHDETDQHGDGDHHKPHSASDHQLQTPIKQQGFSAALVFLPAATTPRLTSPEKETVSVVFERNGAPGESPPDPFQPRAPPLT